MSGAEIVIKDWVEVRYNVSLLGRPADDIWAAAQIVGGDVHHSFTVRFNDGTFMTLDAKCYGTHWRLHRG